MQIVLVGAGHAHLHLVRQAGALRRTGIDLTLISPATFLYSGLASAALSGGMALDVGEIDVARLAATHGVRHLADTAQALDRDRREVQLTGGGTVSYDAVSFNIGSRLHDPERLLSEPGVWPAKPLDALLSLRPMIEARIADTGKCPAIVVAGGGQSANELAAALCGLCERHGVTPQIVVIHPDTAQTWAPPGAWRRLRAQMRHRGVDFRNDRVIRRSPGRCQLASEELLDCEVLLLATGLVGPDLLGRLGLAVNDRGRIVTTATLQSISDPRVFAVGDCAVIAGAERPCAGVFGVRAAPILLKNLMALSRNMPLTAYRPPTRWLSIMDLGNGTGLAQWGRAWWLGAMALRWKRWLDLGFVRSIRSAEVRLHAEGIDG